jgi:predicted transcriptional regulator
MATTTVRIPEAMRDNLKIIASVEKKNIKEILSELINEYIERHKETLEILSRPDWVEAINKGLRASEKGETVKWRKKKSAK